MAYPDQFRETVNAALRDLNLPGSPRELYEPVEYILSLGGKRLRPLLVMMGNDLFDGIPEHALKPALAIEVFHNFTLVHDDIMDKAPLRRGKATIHEKWNNDIAILSGDAMMIKAYELVIQTREDVLPEILKTFNRTALEVCEGQQEDMNFETRNDVTIDEYLEMITKKTAVLLGCALEVGALSAGVNTADRQNVYDFGKNIGIAFQLKDDLLDVYAKDGFGKQIGGDIIANKKTYLLLKALELAKGEDYISLQNLLTDQAISQEDKVEQVKAIYDKLSIPQHTEAKAAEYYERAMSAISHISADSHKKSLLIDFAKDLMGRMT